MKSNLLLPLFMVFSVPGLQAQVTQINSNKSLGFTYPLSNTKAVYVSLNDETLWVTDGTLGNTIQLSADIKFVSSIGSTAFLDGKLIFAGTTPVTGTEVYITDGTPGGTILVKDINPGAPGSSPDNEVALLNGFLYFTAERPAEGRELWRTDGTPGGTTFVKDMVGGTGGSNYPGKYHLFSTGTYLLLMARTPASGVELWRSDGTDIGTVILKDINSGVDSSGVQFFSKFNNLVLFEANDGVLLHGIETWKTDGTPGGTTILKDINPGPANSKPLFSLGYFTFNGRAYFSADDGTNGAEIWSTDGTEPNTSLLKNIEPGAGSSLDFLVSSVIVGNKFIFSSTNFSFTRNQLWESDGTTGGTKLFKNFDGGSTPILFNPGPVFFQGNKFFFMAETAAAGSELWISDGIDSTVARTHIVKDINVGAGGSDPINGFYIYTTAALYFAANNGTNGRELWKSDGTSGGGTSMVADIIPGSAGSNPELNGLLVNGKILFEATNGDDPVLTDLYAVDGTFFTLPVSIVDFTVMPASADAILNWRTSQELNSKNFTIQRSFDGLVFQTTGTVAASGTTSIGHVYSFIDAGVINSGKSMVYYRLLITDIDGKSALSPVITLKLKGTRKWNVRLLNNPISDNMKVLLSGITTNVQLSIIDMSGKILYTSSLSAVNGQISLPAASLPHGKYMLMTETANERKTIQFVK